MFHQTIYSIENKFQISRLSPMDNRKIKHPFSSPPPSVCIFFSFSSFFFVFMFYFFLSTFLFILVLIKFPQWAEISIYFQFLNCIWKFLPISQNFPRTSFTRSDIFCTPALHFHPLLYFSLENIEFSGFFCS